VKSGYLLDTNHVGLAVRTASTIRDKIKELRSTGARIGTCTPVLCEIEAGIQQVNDPAQYRLNLNRLLNEIRIWPIDESTALLYGQIHQSLKKRGRVLSQVDIMVAALAMQMDLVVVTSDRDFSAVEDISVEDWTKS
jgi:tRNA(fMet)-specific endonuclease VapC